MWQRLPYETALSWENAIKHAENLSIDQYSDWRLPNIKELQSLQDVALTMPCINTSIFPNVGVKSIGHLLRKTIKPPELGILILVLVLLPKLQKMTISI